MKTPVATLMKLTLTAVISTILLSTTTLIASAGSAVTEPAPDFTLKTLEGEELTLAKLKGNVVLLNFWASWCSPCREEMPALKKLWNRIPKLPCKPPPGLRSISLCFWTKNKSLRSSTISRPCPAP